MSLLCRIGFHAWPRLHGNWHMPAAEPAASNCLRCGRAIASVWRTAYPRDGSRCKPGSCALHDAATSVSPR